MILGGVMKKAAKVLTLLGIIFSGIKMVFEVAAIVLGPIILANKEKAFEILTNANVDGIATIEDVQKLAITMIIGASIALIVEIVVLCFAIKASRAFANGEKKLWPHIVMIVMGALCNGIFYLLGGIFALVETEKLNTSQQQV